MAKNGYIVTITDEGEIYGPSVQGPALGTATSIVFQNTGDKTITVCPADEAIDEFEGIVLAPRPSALYPGGQVIFDLSHNYATINKMRARVHGGGECRISVMYI